MTAADPTVLLTNDSIEQVTHTEQIRLLYRNAPAGITVNIVNGLVVTAVLWDHAPQVLRNSWAMAILLVSVARFILIKKYHRCTEADLGLRRWDVYFSIWASCAGLTWGAIGLWSSFYLSLPHQMFVAFAVGGIAIGALAMSGVFMPAYIAFLLPSLIPLCLGFIAQADGVHVAMGVFTAVFMGALYVMGLNVNRSIVQSIKLSMERATLVDTLRAAYEEANASNRRLAEEVCERHRAESELRDREAIYRGMFEKNQAVKLLIDPTSGKIVDANPAASAYYGYPLEQLKSENIYNINTLPQDTVSECMAWAQTGSRKRFEFRHRLASGQVRDVEVYSGPIEIHGQQLLFSIIHDITDRKRAELSLRKVQGELEKRVQKRTEELGTANARLRQEIEDRKRVEQALMEEKERAQVTLHSIGDAVITTDATGVINYINPVAETLTGWALTKARGRSLDMVFHLVDEQSGEPLQNLAARCLRESHTIRLTEHVTLISRCEDKHPIRASAAPIRDREGKAFGVVLAFSDVTETRRLAELLEHQASHDALTDLVNRREFERRLDHALLGTRKYGSQHALCYLDLDRFKVVNDTAGHVAGDTLLRQIANLLTQKIRGRDTLARLGGDEFGLLLDNCPLDNAFEIANTLVVAVRDFRFLWEKRTFQIGVSIGVAPITAEVESIAQLLSQADVACYTAKNQGRNCVQIYQLEVSDSARRHPETFRAAELSAALKEDRLCVYCQPIISLSTQHQDIKHYELLIRLRDAEGKVMLPESFIPLAERYGLIGTIDRWMVHTVLHQRADGFDDSSATQFTINLSGHSLSSVDFLEFVIRQFQETMFPSEKICFEVAETAVIQNFSQALRFITEMKGRGCRFALDNFGSGVSSFSYLKSLPVDYLKIGGGFVRNMATDSADYATVAAIVQFGHTMGIITIAGHAETEIIVKSLKVLGVDFAQGYAFGFPEPLENRQN